MNKTFKSPLFSTITIDDNSISYRHKGIYCKIDLSEIEYFECLEGIFSEQGEMILKEKGNIHRVPFFSNYNKDIKDIQKSLGIENKEKILPKRESLVEKIEIKRQKVNKKLEEFALGKDQRNKEIDRRMQENEDKYQKDMKEAKEDIKQLATDFKKDMGLLKEKQKLRRQDLKESIDNSKRDFEIACNEIKVGVSRSFTLNYIGGHPSITSESKVVLNVKGDKINMRKGLKVIELKNIIAARCKIEEEVWKRIGLKKNKKITAKSLVIECSDDFVDYVIVLTGKDSQKAQAAIIDSLKYSRRKNAITESNVASSIQNETSNVDNLMKLKELLDSDLITREEFDLEKKKIIGT